MNYIGCATKSITVYTKDNSIIPLIKKIYEYTYMHYL